MTTQRTDPLWKSQFGRNALASLFLAALYVLLARLGLTLASVGRSVTLVWPPTGLSLAVLFVFGRRLWPGVFCGALIVNGLTPGVPLLSACGMAAGNTTEAVLGATLLWRARFSPGLRQPNDVLKLLVLGAMLSTLSSATIGPLSLLLGGAIPRQVVPNAGLHWWIGDLMGDLIVAPLLLVWLSRDENHTPCLTLEGLLLLVLLATMSALVFTHPVIFLFAAQPYAVFPLLIWAGLRFGTRGSASANFIVSAVSIWVTVRGQGPFARSQLDESLLLVQTFMAVVGLTSLILGATAAARADALRAREAFISIASHEIRTPLTALQLQIHRLANTLEQRWKAVVPIDDMSGPLNVIKRQVVRMLGLAEVLLDLTRLRTGDLSLELGEVDLGALVDESVEALRGGAAEVGVPMEVEVKGPIVGHWDKMRLHQVVTNVIDNAIKYGAGKPIQISASIEDGTATLNVKDQGGGIPERDQERIFRRYERQDPGRHASGMGLGLHIAREIVEAHHGQIRVTSRPGTGATFTLTLPLGPTRPWDRRLR